MILHLTNYPLGSQLNVEAERLAGRAHRRGYVSKVPQTTKCIARVAIRVATNSKSLTDTHSKIRYRTASDHPHIQYRPNAPRYAMAPEVDGIRQALSLSTWADFPRFARIIKLSSKCQTTRTVTTLADSIRPQARHQTSMMLRITDNFPAIRSTQLFSRPIISEERSSSIISISSRYLQSSPQSTFGSLSLDIV
jgi:hypothetical protein